MNKIEFLHNIDKYKGEDHSTFLQHYGILGQKWGQRRWQNADGTFNEEGKQRYFGSNKVRTGTNVESTGKKSSSSDEDKVSGMKSDVKDYLKFRNKMLKKRTTEELNKWYRENNKAADKQMLKDAKKVDKQRDKFYKNQLKDFYDDPNELVADLDRIYKIGGIFDSKEEKEAKALKKEAEKFNKEFEKADFIKRQELLKNVINDKRYKPLFDQIDQNDTEKNKDNLKRIEEIFDDYKDKEIEHLATAGIMNMFTNGYYPNPTMEDVANCAWFYAYEDGNQGSNTAEYLYSTIDKGVKAEELVNLYNDLHRHSNIKEEAKATLKENPMLANVDERYLNRMINKKLDDKYSDNTGYWNLYAATEGSGEPTDKQRKDYKEAKKIATKLNSSCGNSNGWDYLNQAIENLDLSDKELKNMTQSDWDKLNAEINKLKK